MGLIFSSSPFAGAFNSAQNLGAQGLDGSNPRRQPQVFRAKKSLFRSKNSLLWGAGGRTQSYCFLQPQPPPACCLALTADVIPISSRVGRV